MFGILGIILYRDRFGYCEDSTNFDVSKKMVNFNLSIIYNYI